MTVRVEGVDRAVAGLRAHMRKIQGATMAGLLEGGLQVQATAQERVPHELGKLKGSAYTRRAMDRSFAAEVGFGADYALAIHENTEQRLKGIPRPSGLGHYWGPQGQPKYIESAMIDEADAVVRSVEKHARRVG